MGLSRRRYPSAWEGEANGFAASFQLIHEPSFVTRYRDAPFGYENLVQVEPSGCHQVGSSSLATVSAVNLPTPVRLGGSFYGLFGASGGLTGARTAKLSSPLDFPAHPNQPGCRLGLTWRLRPEHRRSVQDGTWTLQYQDGESSAFTVAFGGRVAEGVSLPSAAIADCGVLAVGAANVFVASSGTASFQVLGTANIALKFDRDTATGELTIAGASCADPLLQMNATLVKASI